MKALNNTQAYSKQYVNSAKESKLIDDIWFEKLICVFENLEESNCPTSNNFKEQSIMCFFFLFKMANQLPGGNRYEKSLINMLSFLCWLYKPCKRWDIISG
jgi:hypothetical protein